MAHRLSRLTPHNLTSTNKRNKVIFIVGPTGVGKTEIAVMLGRKIKAEIVSCDSMQVYKKMNIISQNPVLALRRKIRHHLIGFISPEKEYNVADYQKQAALKIKEIIKRNKVPLFVGGSGLYMSVLLDGVFAEGRKNSAIRKKIYRQAQIYGKERLYRKLMKVDPKAALKIHPHDLRRVIRALEVFETTGSPISELHKKRKGIADDYEIKIFCLNSNRGELYDRINNRVEGMFKKGLIKEVKNLLKLRLSKTASQAIAINEVKGYLSGRYGLEEAKRLLKRNSRHLAKRQLCWFGKDKRIDWIFIKHNESIKDIVKRIEKRI